jgi:cephalosporin-C deacetylase-like acetyl esterase
MRVTQVLPSVLVLLVASIASAATIEVTTDRPDAICRVGDPITFCVTVKGGPLKPGEVLEEEVIDDRLQRMNTGEWRNLAEGSIETKVALDRPGFLRAEARLTRKAATRPTTTASVGVAVDPAKLAPSLPVPDDFDTFWADQLKQLAAAPQPQPVLTPVDSKSPAIEAFDVQLADSLPGTNLSAYYARPKGAKPKSLPAILYSQSAGARDSDLPHAVRGAKLGAIALDFNAHGLKNAQPAQFYTDQLNGPLADHRVRGMADRDKVYFRQMYLRGQRARDFLTSQPEWDGRILIAQGSSQGGAQSLVAAGLDPRVTLCLASVPALADLTGPTVGRESGWPKMLRATKEGSFDPKAVEALRYIDVMNFASRIKCRTIVSVGLVDRVCPPSSVYAAYNNIPTSTDKSIVMRPAMGHTFPPDLIAAWDDEIRQHVATMRK